MSCYDPIPANLEDKAGDCPKCGEPVDKDGETVLEGCLWSPVICNLCGDRPCDQSC